MTVVRDRNKSCAVIGQCFSCSTVRTPHSPSPKPIFNGHCASFSDIAIMKQHLIIYQCLDMIKGCYTPLPCMYMYLCKDTFTFPSTQDNLYGHCLPLKGYFVSKNKNWSDTSVDRGQNIGGGDRDPLHVIEICIPSPNNRWNSLCNK